MARGGIIGVYIMNIDEHNHEQVDPHTGHRKGGFIKFVIGFLIIVGLGLVGVVTANYLEFAEKNCDPKVASANC